MFQKNSLAHTVCLCLAFTSLINQSAAVIGIDDVIEVIQLAKTVTLGVVEVWDLVEQRNGGEGLDIPFRNQKQKKILSRVIDLSRRIDNVQMSVSTAALS